MSNKHLLYLTDRQGNLEGVQLSAALWSHCEAAVVKALKAMKIAFPEGAYARYSPSTRQLHVRDCSSSGISVIRTAPRSPVRIAAPIPPTGATTPRIRSI